MIIGAALIIAAGVYYVAAPRVKFCGDCQTETGNNEINNFESCVDAGYPIYQTQPIYCLTPEGEVLVQPVDDQLWDLSDNKRETLLSRIDNVKVWFEASVSTYKYDGSNLTFKGFEDNNDGCMFDDGCQAYVFQFDSSHAGYGDRTGQALAQVITTHVTIVFVKDGVPILAVTDGEFEEYKLSR